MACTTCSRRVYLLENRMYNMRLANVLDRLPRVLTRNSNDGAQIECSVSGEAFEEFARGDDVLVGEPAYPARFLATFFAAVLRGGRLTTPGVSASSRSACPVVRASAVPENIRSMACSIPMSGMGCR